ncbi:hypothetical protein [Modestobacter marinus]|uniref:hypothetical protein n=1 Tax=Modestobacter marinus TaxID=477641 RepID=UPI001C95948A|nr:hypothetical protein [Modestobacter marinus]
MTASPSDPAEARSAALAAARAGVPQTSSRPLEGTLDASGGPGHLASWTARLALLSVAGTVADAIATAVRGSTGGSRRVLLVEDRALAQRDWPYGHVLADLARHRVTLARQEDVLATVIDALLPAGRPPATGGPADRERRRELGDTVAVPLTEGVAAHAASAADLVGLLWSGHTVTSASTETSSSVLTAAVAARLAEQSDLEVLVEGFHLVPARGPVHEALDRVLAADADLARAQARLRTLLAARPADDPDPQLEHARERDRETTDLRMSWAAALAGLMTAPEDGLAPLAAAAVQAAVRGVAGTHVVHLSLDSSGTDVVSRRSLFGPSGRLWLIGGVTVSWLLLRPTGDALREAGSAHQGWRTEYDLSTGASVGAEIPDPPGGTTGRLKTPGLFSASPERAPRLIVSGLALVGGLWLLADAFSKVFLTG